MTEQLPAKPVDWTDRLRDRIKSSIADLIPEEQWDALLKREVDRFMNDQETGPSYSRVTIPSGFAVVLREVMSEEAKKRIREYIEKSPEWQGQFDAFHLDKSAIPPAVHKAFVEALPKMAATVFEGVVGGIRQAALYAVQR